MERAGLKMPRSAIATTAQEADDAMIDIGLPIIVRPAYTLGGRGGGIARTPEEFRAIVRGGLDASPIGQILLDESVIGWGEFELEVMRDHNDNCVIVCSIENIDPMGVHTGDSVTVAPQQTLTDRLYQQLRDQAFTVIRAVGVETGGSNVQFAVNPETEEIMVIEMNPRVSRSSALASKATGFPIAKIAARLAVGYALEEIDNDITLRTPASFEPTIDYVVVKWPRFAFEKFSGVDERLSTHMKSVGEVMAIGRTFQQAFAKAMRSRELDSIPSVSGSREELLTRLEMPGPDRYDVLLAAFAAGADAEEIERRTKIDLWFLRELQALAADPEAPFAGVRTYKSVDTCAAEFAAETPYYYSSWERFAPTRSDGGAAPSRTRSAAASGRASSSSARGPNRIGQGIEFDYCCVHAAMTVREAGRDAVMVNCNPETVSTDYDTSDRLYFEPLTLEDVLGVVEIEQPEGVIVQFGGQTPLKLAAGLQDAGVPILGTSVDAIDLAEDRGRFGALLARLGYEAPPYATAHGVDEALAASETVGFPLLVRPSYVLGGRAMEIVYSAEDLADYLRRTGNGSPATQREIFLDRFLENAIEVDVDALCDGAERLDRRDHAARRGGRDPLRRQRLRAAAALARARDARRDPRAHARHRARPEHGRPHQHPVRGHARRAPVRHRGQPARVADRAVRLQGDRRAAGEDGLPAHARRAHRRPRAAVGGDADRPRLRQGGGAAVRPLHGLRRAAEPGDALDRRGDGRRARLPDGVREGAGGGRRDPARRRARCSSR